MKKTILSSILFILFMPLIASADQAIHSRPVVDDLTPWLEAFENPSRAIVEDDSKKTATLYNEEKKIYRIDISTKSRLQTFSKPLDLGFMIDVSNSMLFPSKLVLAESDYPIYSINGINMWGQPSPDHNLDTGKVYYLIADANETATVFRIFFSIEDGVWRAGDASKEPTRENTFRIGIDNWNMAYTDSYTLYPFGRYDNSYNRYDLYWSARQKYDDTPITRLDDLQESMNNTRNALRLIMSKTIIAKTPSVEQDARIAFNTFNRSVVEYRPSFISISDPESINISYVTGPATHTDYALGAVDEEQISQYFGQDRSAATFEWNPNHLSYAVLITDGAPQSSNNPISDLAVIQAADRLKSNGVTLITIGLSIEDVTRGKYLLNEIASEDDVGEKYFYVAENGGLLANLFLQIIRDLISEADAISDVEDVISEDFYPVDKETGEPLKANDRIDLEGKLVSSNYRGPVGIISYSNNKYKVKWEYQEVKPDGWKGSVFVKAKEGVYGENITTNFGEATINSEYYRLPGTDYNYELKDEYKANVKLASPTVVIKGEKESTIELNLYDNKKIIEVFSGITSLTNTEFYIKNERVLKIEDGKIIPLRIGKTDIEFEIGSIKYTIHVTVSNADAIPNIPKENPNTTSKQLMWIVMIMIMCVIAVLMFWEKTKLIKREVK